MYGPVPVLPTTSDQMEAKPVIPQQCHRKCGARKKNRYILDLSHGAQKYLCKLCGSKGHYTSKCNNPLVSSVIAEYEKRASKYLHELKVIKVVHEGTL